MSHALRNLERALRIEQLSRTIRTVEVTPAGRPFASLASPVLTELSSATRVGSQYWVSG
jgi:DNA-binding transcriptional LysR family regulator